MLGRSCNGLPYENLDKTAKLLNAGVWAPWLLPTNYAFSAWCSDEIFELKLSFLVKSMSEFRLPREGLLLGGARMVGLTWVFGLGG
jgi:hypothetical protein